MSSHDDDVEGRGQGWRTLAALHARLEDRLERSLQAEHQLSVTEYTVLDVLNRQDEHHLRMNQLADTVVLSQSATTRLVSRLEDQGLLSRYICATDRRGIYTEVTEAGRARLARARTVHDRTLAAALTEAEQRPELAVLVAALRETLWAPSRGPASADRQAPSGGNAEV
ncbi:MULTISPECIES: MarR family winged helix-turn-helix transcriptional regulator [Actinoalloteichus]|uniref:Transcriptional regulator n=1 Tax=Actinoalloteichus fjordicus TaxID=1612552 RepID=A0AAC9LH30_9PSEU|nr:MULTISPECIES: MarR family winged helix-turn-helix transcriptional regulator [Actinoalloteichus]APU17778.1 transcriptional regulator [Actinoalloteichus fjordicus]APU23856.1 transcriptional regulator [Actinoalloteichus sp. GBA129-24]